MGRALGALTVICIMVLLILYLQQKRREGHHSNEDTGTQHCQLISPYYDILQPPQHSSRGESLISTSTRMVTTTKGATSSLSYTVQQAPVAAITSSTLGNMADSNNLVSVGGTLPISEDFVNDPPPLYWESW